MKLTDVNREEIIRKAISTFGDKKQIAVAIEEMSELTKELCKAIRVYDTEDVNSYVDNIIEEIADVEIMLKQLRIIFAIRDIEVENMTDFKLIRLENRLREE